MAWLIQSCESWLMIVNPGQGNVCPLCISPPVCRHQDVICNNKNEQKWCNETRNLILNLSRVVCAQFAFPLQCAGTRTQFATINTHSKSAPLFFLVLTPRGDTYVGHPRCIWLYPSGLCQYVLYQFNHFGSVCDLYHTTWWYMASVNELCQTARKASWSIEGVEPGNQEGPGW